MASAATQPVRLNLQALSAMPPEHRELYQSLIQITGSLQEELSSLRKESRAGTARVAILEETVAKLLQERDAANMRLAQVEAAGPAPQPVPPADAAAAAAAPREEAQDEDEDAEGREGGRSSPRAPQAARLAQQQAAHREQLAAALARDSLPKASPWCTRPRRDGGDDCEIICARRHFEDSIFRRASEGILGDLGESNKGWQHSVHRAHTAQLFLISDGEAKSTCVFSTLGDEVAEPTCVIHLFATAPPSRREGFGSLLLETLEDRFAVLFVEVSQEAPAPGPRPPEHDPWWEAKGFKPAEDALPAGLPKLFHEAKLLQRGSITSPRSPPSAGEAAAAAAVARIKKQPSWKAKLKHEPHSPATARPRAGSAIDLLSSHAAAAPTDLSARMKGEGKGKRRKRSQKKSKKERKKQKKKERKKQAEEFIQSYADDNLEGSAPNLLLVQSLLCLL